MAHSVVSSLLSSESGTVFDGFGQESNSFDGLSELGLGIGKESLGVDDGLLTLGLGGGVGISVGSRRGDLSLADNEIFVMLSVSGSLLTLFLSDQVVDKSNNIINNTFGSEVNL